MFLQALYALRTQLRLKLFFRCSLFLLALGHGVHSRAQNIDPQLIEDVRQVSEGLLERYPKDQYHFLALGRSPTLFVAYLQLVAENYISPLPLSSLQNLGDLKLLLTHRQYGIHLSAKDTALLFEHFENFIPKAEQLQGRKLMIIDYSFTGASLMRAFEYINEYLKAHDRPTLSGGVALISEKIGQKRMKKVFRSYNFSFIKTWPLPEKSQLESLLMESRFDQRSPYGRYEVGMKTVKEMNPDYLSLMSEMSEYVKSKAPERFNCRSLLSPAL